MPLDWDAPSDGLLDATEPILSLLSGTECLISMLDQSSLPPDGMTTIPVWATSACIAWLDPRSTSVDGAGNIIVANSAPGRGAFPFTTQTSPTESPTVVAAGSGGPVLSFAGAQRLITSIPPSFGGQLGTAPTAGTCVWVAELFAANQPTYNAGTTRSATIWTTWPDVSTGDNVSGADVEFFQNIAPLKPPQFGGEFYGSTPPGTLSTQVAEQSIANVDPGALAVYSFTWDPANGQTLRRNGSVIASLSAPFPVTTASANPQDRLVVGAWLAGGTTIDGFMVGKMGHTMLFGRALTSDELTASEAFLSRLTFGQSTPTP